MTLILSIKVNEGLVLAADSVAILTGPDAAGAVGGYRVYHYATKLSGVRKGLPIGLLISGQASISGTATTTLTNELRARLSGKNPHYTDWAIASDSSTYTVREVAERVRQLVYEETYLPAYANSKTKPSLSFFVCGYSGGENHAEEYSIYILADGSCSTPELLQPKEQGGITSAGRVEAIERLRQGYSPTLEEGLRSAGLSPDAVSTALTSLAPSLRAEWCPATMPLLDAVDLARFMFEVASKYERFSSALPLVGGPVDIATVTKYGGFRWIQHKHSRTGTSS